MTRGSSIGANDLTRAPYAPHTEQVRHDFNSTCSAGLTAQATRLHGVRGKKDHASTSMQTGIHTSPGLFSSAIAGPRGEERPRNSFTQFLIDTMAIFVAITFVLVTGIGFGFAIFALMFMSF